MPQTQKEWIRVLQDSGWTRDRGGKHQVKMTKPGERPDHAAREQAPRLQQGFEAALRRQAGL
ncbi:MAG: type II toxin-antitoxin system HicA family toxin [Solirubrobacteraceae bacterium]